MTKTKSGPPARYLEQDFETIEAAVMETERGRWFLSEYARRNRNADTEVLLKAIRKLQNAVLGQKGSPDALRGVRQSIMDMASEIAQTRQEMREIRTDGQREGGIPGATDELDAVVAGTENATSDILRAAEQVQELAWAMREEGAPEDKCDALDTHATDIYTFCSFQDLTGQRIRHVIGALRNIENRLDKLIKEWGLDDIEIRETAGEEDHSVEATPISQEDIDLLMVDRRSAEDARAPARSEHRSVIVPAPAPVAIPAPAAAMPEPEPAPEPMAEVGPEPLPEPELAPEPMPAGEPEVVAEAPQPAEEPAPPAPAEDTAAGDSDSDIFAMIAAELEKVTAEAVRDQVRAQVSALMDRNDGENPFDAEDAGEDAAAALAPEPEAAPMKTGGDILADSIAAGDMADDDIARDDMDTGAAHTDTVLGDLSRAHRMALFT